MCLKEINSYNANTGDVCPRGYYEYEGNCYEEVPSQESGVLSCVEDFSLKDGNCVRNVYEDAEAEYSCSKGELVKKGDLFMIGISDAEKMVCVDKSNAKPPTLRCLTHNHTMIDGKCANGPKPTINGGCEPGDYLVNGGCYDIDNEDQWVCPSGNIYEKSKGTYVDLCPDTFTFIDPILKGYTCSDDFKLVDNKCVKEEYREVTRERACPSGYNLVNNDRCINTNKVVSKQNGYYCNDNARLVGDKCVIYEEIEAKHN